MPDQGFIPGKAPKPTREPIAGQLFQPDPKELNGELPLLQEFELSMALDMMFAMVSIMRNITPNMSPKSSAAAGSGNNRLQMKTTVARLCFMSGKVF
jgi:hypothetical protein